MSTPANDLPKWPWGLRIATAALVVFIGWFAEEIGLIGWWL